PRPTNLAGAEGFEPPSSVLETDSLTVELTPLSFNRSSDDLVIADHSGRPMADEPIAQIIYLLGAACACGTGGRTSSSPAGPASFCGSWLLNSSALCNHRTAMLCSLAA